MSKQEQIEIAEKLQLKLLNHFDAMLDKGTLSATDAATLARLLMANGWSIDPKSVPTGLRAILTEGLNAIDVDEDEEMRQH